MRGSQKVDVSAILSAAYRRPETELDQVAGRVRARLALMETVGEAFRLLLEAPGSALTATLGERDYEADESSDSEEGSR